jgi:hypothetical protein
MLIGAEGVSSRRCTASDWQLTTVTQRYYVAECTTQGYAAMMLLLLASFMVMVPSTDVSAATCNRFLGRYQSGRDDDSPCADKEKCEHSK